MPNHVEHELKAVMQKVEEHAEYIKDLKEFQQQTSGSAVPKDATDGAMPSGRDGAEDASGGDTGAGARDASAPATGTPGQVGGAARTGAASPLAAPDVLSSLSQGEDDTRVHHDDVYDDASRMLGDHAATRDAAQEGVPLGGSTPPTALHDHAAVGGKPGGAANPAPSAASSDMHEGAADGRSSATSGALPVREAVDDHPVSEEDTEAYLGLNKPKTIAAIGDARKEATGGRPSASSSAVPVRVAVDDLPVLQEDTEAYLGLSKPRRTAATTEGEDDAASPTEPLSGSDAAGGARDQALRVEGASIVGGTGMGLAADAGQYANRGRAAGADGAERMAAEHGDQLNRAEEGATLGHTTRAQSVGALAGIMVQLDTDSANGQDQRAKAAAAFDTAHGASSPSPSPIASQLAAVHILE